MQSRLLSLAVAALCGFAHTSHSATIWKEGEDASRSTMQRHPWWYDQVKKEVLSGGDWISNFGKEVGEAEYRFDAPEAGEYTFWIRANPLNSSLSYALNGGAWTAIDLEKDKRGEQNIAADNKPDLRFIAWVKAGKVKLNEGAQTLKLRLDSKHENHGAIDAFVFTTDPFVPQGTMKPGESGTAASDAEADAKDAIWIEGEKPSRQAMNRHPGWYDQVKKEVLSGGDWISNYSAEKEGTAEYDFEVVTPDTYAFWVRANGSVGARLEWQLDDGAWTAVDFKEERGQQNIAVDNKPDMRFISWVKAASVKLAPGKHTVRFKMASGADKGNHGGLDAFVFTRIPFVPAGAKKPVAANAAGGAAEWFPLLPDEDTFDPRSVIDMSRYVPAPAGALGFLRAAGDKFVFDKAPKQPMKFWGVGANLEAGKYSREQLTQRIKYLRKFGVNVVRQHPLFDDVTTDGKLDPKKLDDFDWYFAELKKHGIYMDWSVFYHFPIGPDAGYEPTLFAELPKMGDGELRDTYGLITMAPELWKIRTRWLTDILAHKNPYTGLRYADDPALITVEMQNEDAIFFWNPLAELVSGKKWPEHSKRLRQKWAAWVKAKYKNDAAVKTAWGKLEGESLESGELKLMGPWELDAKGPQGPFTGQTKRAGDYLEFLTEMQRELYTTCEKAIRATGYKAVVVTTNWLGGSAPTDAANIYTDTVGSAIDRHNYGGGGAGGHGIAEGQIYADSHLPVPGAHLFGIFLKQVEGMPFTMSEWTMSPPNRWKLEAAPIMAFYGLGLQGWDASYHFAQSGTRLGDGWPRMTSYASDTPHYIGQFPALAFALYHGHITEGPIVSARRLTREQLFSGTDPLRQDYYNGHELIRGEGGTPREAFAVGRVTLSFTEEKKPEVIDFKKFWSEQNKIIRSATGELVWDYGRELIQVRTARTQALIGRAGSEEQQLPGVSATVKTPFVSLIFTPLDNAPLAESKRILITALAQDKQTGTRYNAEGTKLEAVGTAPLLLEPVQAKLKFAGAKPVQIQALDHYGALTGKSVPVAADGSFTIDGTYRAYYYEVQR